MQHRLTPLFLRAVAGAAVGAAVAGSAWAAPSEAGRAPRPAGLVAAETHGTDGTASPHDAAGSDPAPSRNAARSRMRECGHQWSSMKKSGAASGLTWKDFSQGCLAK